MMMMMRMYDFEEDREPCWDLRDPLAATTTAHTHTTRTTATTDKTQNFRNYRMDNIRHRLSSRISWKMPILFSVLAPGGISC